MSQASDRRAFPRRPFELAVFAYENGARFHAIPTDISLGGAYLSTNQVERIAIGDLLSVVFGEDSGCIEPVYLFGEVVRRTTAGTERGIGLRWTKAVSCADAASLAQFVERVFGVKATAAEARVTAGYGKFRSVFSFAPVHKHATGRLAAQGSRSERTTVPEMPAQKAPDEIVDLNVKVVESCPTATRHPTPPKAVLAPAGEGILKVNKRGTMTDQILAGGERAPVFMSALLRAGHELAELTITQLGVASLRVVLPKPPETVPHSARIIFNVPTTKGPIAVNCDCAVLSTRPDPDKGEFAMDLSISSLDEGTSAGVLGAYVKWLLYHDLAEA